MTAAPAKWHFPFGSSQSAGAEHDRLACRITAPLVFSVIPMTELRRFIDRLVHETEIAGDDLQSLFRPKIPKKMALDRWLERNLRKHGPRILKEWFRPVPEQRWPNTVGELAAHLHLSASELTWFADLHHRNPARGPLSHYRYRWIPKRRGDSRLLMEPKESLKLTQRRLLETLINDIPLHEAAHGFRRARSIKTFAASHVGKRVVLKMDLGDFFPSITFVRVAGLFRWLGYREEIARLLAGLCTHRPPSTVAKMDRHLPQGAPTSPALANAVAYRLDCRLAGFAMKAGLNYTRYADDLAFSGDRITEAFSHHVGGIILEEGFRIHPRKTRFMTRSTKQHLAGVIVNEHPNFDRHEFDLLKAILHNCARHGPAEQNVTRDHLRGRLAAVQMLNPVRGGKLLRIYEEIVW